MRIITGCIAVLVCAAVSVARGGQSEPSRTAIQTERLAANLYVLRGGGENTVAFVTATGVVLVDGKNPGWGSALVETLKELTPKPITTVINTHVHHTNGNAELPGTFAVVAHENTARLMREGNPVVGTVGPPSWSVFRMRAEGRATRTFTGRLTIGTGAERVELHHFGPAHTGGDLFIVFPAARVLHTGDAFPGRTMAVIDTNNGGRALTYAAALDRAAALPGIDAVVPGHGPGTMTMADVREHADFIRQFLSDARAARAAGRSVEDFAAAWKVPARFSGYMQPAVDRVRTNAAVVWQELE